MLTAIILGTTYSGHASRTTLGNCVRVACYMAFISHEMGYDGLLVNKCLDARLYIAGDDVTIKCTKEFFDKFM